MNIITTRPERDNARLIKNLEARGHKALASPLLSINPLPDIAIPQQNWQAILITSANALQALQDIGFDTALLSVPAYCVGPASAAKAKGLGFEIVVDANGDMLALFELCKNKLLPDNGPLLYLSGKVRSGDLAGMLSTVGFNVTRIEVYDAIPANTLQLEISDVITSGDADGVCLYSPRTAQIWCDLVNQHDLNNQVKKLVHFCLSEAVADKVRASALNESPIVIARYPNDDAMIEAIENVHAKQQG